jgi:hypothetical protein
MDEARDSSLDRCMASAMLAVKADGDGIWSNVRKSSRASSSSV